MAARAGAAAVTRRDMEVMAAAIVACYYHVCEKCLKESKTRLVKTLSRLNQLYNSLTRTEDERSRAASRRGSGIWTVKKHTKFQKALLTLSATVEGATSTTTGKQTIFPCFI